MSKDRYVDPQLIAKLLLLNHTCKNCHYHISMRCPLTFQSPAYKELEPFDRVQFKQIIMEVGTCDKWEEEEF